MSATPALAPREQLDALRRRTDLSNKAKGDLFEQLSEAVLAHEFPGSEITPDFVDDERDLGVDRIITTSTGEIITAQMKCYGPDNAVLMSDVNNFVSRSRRLGASRMILIHTGRLSRNARDPIADNGVEVWDFEHLSSLPFPVSWDPESLTPDPSVFARRELRPHQLAALADISTDDPRGRCLSATATGKTLVFIEWAASYGFAAVGAPSLELIHQHTTEIRRQYPRAQILIVCGDSELREYVPGLPVTFTTDTAAAAAWLASHAPLSAPETQAPVFVLVTYASGPTLLDAATAAGVTFEALVCDEAHNTASVSQSVTGKRARNNTLVSPEFPARRRRFFTATERVHADSLQAKVAARGGLIYSMDNPELYGPVQHDLTFTRARELDLIAGFAFAVAVVSAASVHELIHQGGLVSDPANGLDLDNPAHVEDVASALHTLRTATDHDLHSILSVHNTVEAAQRATVIFGKVAAALDHINGTDVAARLNALTVSAESSHTRRKHARRILGSPTEFHPHRHPEAISIVANVRLFGEGVDVPAIDAVSYFDRRSSAVDVVQTIGRAARKNPAQTATATEKVAAIIVPLFVDTTTAADVEAAFTDSARMSKFYDLATALRDGDITPRQRVMAMPARGKGFSTPDVVHVETQLAKDFDFRALDAALTSILHTGRWDGLVATLERAQQVDFLTFAAAVREVQTRLQRTFGTAGLSGAALHTKVDEVLTEIARDTNGDVEAFLAHLRAGTAPAAAPEGEAA